MKLWIFIFSFVVTLLFPTFTLAQESVQPTTFEAQIVTIKEETPIEVQGRKQLQQKIELKATSGEKTGQTFTIETGNIPTSNVRKFQAGDLVVVQANKDLEGNDLFYITDYVRRGPLYLLVAIFVGVTILIGRLKGASSLLGMGFSFLVIFTFILPQILAGQDPIFITILASMVIIPVTFYLSHGVNRKTTTAIVGTVIALLLTGLLANLFVEATRLSGFSSDEATFLQAAKQGSVNIRGILLAGIIVGLLGILDDITISQAAIVYQLKKTASHLTFGQLFSKGMDIGKDHIASVVNTLILVYAGAAMPLLLLFVDNPHPFTEIINYEIVAEEVVRMLVGSIGLILAVPITTFLAAYTISNKDPK